MKKVITVKADTSRRPVKASYGDMSDSAAIAARKVYNALYNLWSVLGDYEDYLDAILDDPSYYEATINEVRRLESFLGYN